MKTTKVDIDIIESSKILYRDINKLLAILNKYFNLLYKFDSLDYAIRTVFKKNGKIRIVSDGVDSFSIDLYDTIKSLQNIRNNFSHISENDPNIQLVKGLISNISQYILSKNDISNIYAYKALLSLEVYKICTKNPNDILCKELRKEISKDHLEDDIIKKYNTSIRNLKDLLEKDVSILEKVLYLINEIEGSEGYRNAKNLILKMFDFLKETNINIVERVRNLEILSLEEVIDKYHIEIRLPTEEEHSTEVIKVSIGSLTKPEDIGGYNKYKKTLYSLEGYFTKDRVDGSYRIIIFGPSGSGKTELTKSFVSYLRSRGIKVGYISISRFSSFNNAAGTIIYLRRKIENVPLVFHIYEGEKSLSKDDNEILRALEDLVGLENTIVILEANYTDQLSPRIMGRIGISIQIKGLDRDEYKEVVDTVIRRNGYEIDENILKYLEYKLFDENRDIIVVPRLIHNILYNIHVRNLTIEDQRKFIDQIIESYRKQYSLENRNIRDFTYTPNKYSNMSI